jgi:protein O-GlcNAc transferase
MRPMGASDDIEQMFAAAQLDHQAGRLAEAEAAYRKILVRRPDHADSLHFAGIIAYQTGRLHAAAQLIGKAIAGDRNVATFHNSLGVVLTAQGKLVKAVASLRRALALMPDVAETHNNLGVALAEQGKRDEAMDCYRRALALDPDYAAAHNNLGNALLAQERRADAAACFRRALALNPDFADAHNSLGVALKDADMAEAAACFRRALRLRPDYVEAHNNLGNALAGLGRLDQAVASFRRAIELRPDYVEAHGNLGDALRNSGKLTAAAAAYRAALARDADYAEAHHGLGNALVDQCRLDEAIACYRGALARKPDSAAFHSSLLFALNYHDGPSPEALHAQARRWNEQHAGHPPPEASFPNDRTADRRLRIGYVSPDLRRHSVAHFLEPLLRAHDHRTVEVFCYAEVARPDAVTQELKALADHWRITVGMSDAAVAERIGSDRIDILIDLAGHSAGNRLPVFARKPAPVQVTWLGYPGTTGLATIDYRLVDAISDPEQDRAAWSSETLVRLADGFLCYRAPPGAPPARVSDSKILTFGSFNNPTKLSASTLDVWAALLVRLPQARLLLKGLPFADAPTRALFETGFAERGVTPERLVLVGHIDDDAAHLAHYHQIDIALDPFPYNGTATTCEALWMGVPVVALRGDRHAGRVGASLLTGLGLDELIADDAGQYIEIAAALAADRAKLAEWRGILRARMAASPLCDAEAFARKIEAAYRAMWRAWVLKQV